MFKLLLKKNSDKKLFIISLFLLYIISSKINYLCRKNIIPTFFETYLTSASCPKSASFELVLPHEVPKLNEHPGRSFDKIRYPVFLFCNDIINNLKYVLTKFLHSVDKLALKGLCKFQVNKPENARVTAVQSLENLHTFMLRQPWWWAKECPPAQFTI